MKQAGILLLALLMCLAAAGAETAPEGMTYLLEAEDGRYVALTLPPGFGPFRPDTETTDIPFTYAADQPQTGCRVQVQLSLETQKDQQIALRKVRDPANGIRVWEDMTIGDHVFLVYTGRAWTNEWHFLRRTKDGYDARFCYTMPEEQEEMPREALDILATLRIIPAEAIENAAE
ncbi:MAG: hypothetical protein IKP32_03525 [Clostridia bacterium]|nr:hypothetical protein [Clostridia bacterium]